MYGKAVDWWSFGTLVFEMLTGLPPFYADDVQQMYTKIMTAELSFPSGLNADAVDLIRRVCLYALNLILTLSFWKETPKRDYKTLRISSCTPSLVP